MNKATQNLEEDHNHILKLKDVMEKIAEGTRIDPNVVEEIADMIRNFADGLHHAKEEKLLFPLMSDKGFSTENGPVAVMLAEHDQGRAYVNEMIEGQNILRQGDFSAESNIREAMLGYAVLLRNHIAKENNILFRMADNLMNNQEEQSLHTNFLHIDSSGHAGTPASGYIERIGRLADIYI